MLYDRWIRPLLFRCDAELAHRSAVRLCELAGRSRVARAMLQHRFAPHIDPRLRCTMGDLYWEHPIGLAAGWDKSGTAVPALQSMGWAAVEIGSISMRPSQGNSGTRLARIPQRKAIWVNYGLPNDGAERIAKRIASRRSQEPEVDGALENGCRLGINLVSTNDPKGRAATLEQILDDYAGSFRLLARCADYVTLNLSCPNSSDGCQWFSDPDRIAALLERLKRVQVEQIDAGFYAKPKPLFLKVSPQLVEQSAASLVATCLPFAGVAGFLVNLPAGPPHDFDQLAALPSVEVGAIAGRPARSRLLACVGTLFQAIPAGRFAIIGGGGIFTAEDVFETIVHGATAVQVYSGFVYAGPSIIRRLQQGLGKQLAEHGFTKLQDAVGSAWRPVGEPDI